MEKYLSRTPVLNLRSAVYLILLTTFITFSTSQAQIHQYQDSLDLIGILEQNCHQCKLETPGSGYNWDTLQPLHTWPGVTLTNGRITQIQISNVGLEGAFSPLNHCEKLVLLDIEQNALTSLPNLNNQDQLAMLFCRHNQLPQLPDLTQNGKLIFLDCSNNLLTSLPDLSGSKLISTLNCQYNQLSTLPELDSLSHLIRLSCEHNKLDVLPSFANCSNLQELNCNHNRLSSLPDMEDCPNLLYLNCQDNFIGALPNMDSLNLQTFNCKNNQLTFFHLEPLVGRPVVFEYAPQDTMIISPEDSLLMLDTETFQLSPLQAGGDSTHFQWFLETVMVTGPQTEVIPQGANGFYRCELTNPQLPLLILQTRKVHVYYDKGVRRHDATVENRADMFDLAQVALSYGETGKARRIHFRNTCDTVLVPAYDWTDAQHQNKTFKYGPDEYNLKHVDCNGDGRIDASDINCVTNFYKANQLPSFLLGQEQDSISAEPVGLSNQIKALDSHRVEIPYHIKLAALPPGMDSIKVRGFLFSRPLVSSPHYSFSSVQLNFPGSDFISNSVNALWMDQNQGLNPADLDPGSCITQIDQPRDVGVFLKDSARVMKAGEILIGDIVTITDVFKLDNSANLGLDSLPVIMRMFQVVLYIENDTGGIQPLVVNCTTDSVMIYPDSLFEALFPPQQGSPGPNLPNYTHNQGALQDSSSLRDPSNKTSTLYQNGPNPFSEWTIFWFDVAFAMQVEFQVLDGTGRIVRQFSGYYQEGRHTLKWDGKTDTGHRIAPGTYLIRMIAGGHQQVRKMVVMKPRE